MPYARRNTLLLLCGLAVTAMVTLYYATEPGVGINPDSVTFIMAARSLVAGHGLSTPHHGLGSSGFAPLTHFPPLYPALLAATAPLGQDLLAGARWLDILLFGANVLLVGMAIYECTRGSLCLSLFGAVLMATSVDMLVVHSFAFSEPPFITLGALGLYLLAAYIERRRRWLLVGAAGAVACAFLTRYPGAALIATGALGLLLLGERPLKARAADALAFTAIASTPMALWLAWNTLAAGRPTDRTLALHPITVRHIKDGVLTLAGWLVPRTAIPATAFAALIAVGELLLVGLLALAVLLRRRTSGMDDDQASLPVTAFSLLAIFIVVYVLLLVVSISLFDVNTPLNGRVLSPVYLAGLILVLGLAHAAVRSLRASRFVAAVLLVGSLVLVGVYDIQAIRFIAQVHDSGQGYASLAWRDSKLLARVRKLPPETLVVSNGWDLIYMHTGRMAYGLPSETNRLTARARVEYTSQLAAMKEILETEHGLLVYFRRIQRAWMPSEEDLKQNLPLHVVSTSSEGSIYRIEPSEPASP